MFVLVGKIVNHDSLRLNHYFPRAATYTDELVLALYVVARFIVVFTCVTHLNFSGKSGQEQGCICPLCSNTQGSWTKQN